MPVRRGCDRDPTVRRYAATTTSETFGEQGATITVAATTSAPAGTVLVEGVPLVDGEATVTGVEPGEEISVVYDDPGACTSTHDPASSDTVAVRVRVR